MRARVLCRLREDAALKRHADASHRDEEVVRRVGKQQPARLADLREAQAARVALEEVGEARAQHADCLERRAHCNVDALRLLLVELPHKAD